MLTNAGGAITDTYDYDAFGNIIKRTGSTPNDYLYSGEQFDANIGFYYLRARYMNPAAGRFLSMDSFEGDIADPITLHKYLYADADPVDRVDPANNKGGIPGKALAGWMVYFASHLGKVPDDLPVHSRIELKQKGTLLVLCPEPISAERPDQIEAAKKMITSLQSAGLIPA